MCHGTIKTHQQRELETMQSKIFKEDHNPLSLFHDDDDDAPGKG